jgi:hypothetical protein
MRRLILAGFLVAASGCISPQNDRITIGQSTRLEAFETPQPRTVTLAERVAAPSVTGIDRSGWQQTTLLVPVDGIYHHPTYGDRVRITDKTARQRGLYPTAVSALELYNGSEGQQQAEAVLNQLVGVGNVIILPFRMVLCQLPWWRRMSPEDAYARYNRPEQPQPPYAGPPEQPFMQPPPQGITP